MGKTARCGVSIKPRLPILCVVIFVSVIAVSKVRAQSQQTTSTTPTIKVTHALAFLDVMVLDKKGHTVTSGLTKDDFTVTEDKVPQIIFSFEAPELHVMGVGEEDDNPTGNAPKIILVMDLLNSSFEDFAYIRYETAQFLKAQPSRDSFAFPIVPLQCLGVPLHSFQVLEIPPGSVFDPHPLPTIPFPNSVAICRGGKRRQ
jgi:hypothetical protein